MTGYEFGDVVLVPFPFTDQSAVKKRPAVVISSDAYHRERPDLIIMAITTLERGLIINRLGQLKENDLAALRRAIASVLG